MASEGHFPPAYTPATAARPDYITHCISMTTSLTRMCRPAVLPLKVTWIEKLSNFLAHVFKE